MTRTVSQLFDLKDQTALVTGGSRGLGLQMAYALGEAGARIMLSSRKAADLEQAADDLQRAGIDARWIAADCGREDDIRRLADETLQRMGDVDILVNNAGAAWGAPAEDHPVAAWDKLMNLNVRGYFILSQHIGKRSMIPRQRGRIINVASIAGLGGNPPELKTLAYNTSKGAVINFTRALGCEWGQYNITVNAICPGFFPSRMTQATLEQLGEQQLAAHAPLRRLGIAFDRGIEERSDEAGAGGVLGGRVAPRAQRVPELERHRHVRERVEIDEAQRAVRIGSEEQIRDLRIAVHDPVTRCGQRR